MTRKATEGPAEGQTWAEWQASQPRRYKRKHTPKKPMSERQRAAFTSPAHLEHLRRQRERLAAEGRRPKTPIGTVQGWGGSKRPELERIRADAKQKADLIVDELEKQGVVEPAQGPEAIDPVTGLVDDAAAANAALRYAVSVVIDKQTQPADHRGRMATLVLQYTKAKPEQKTTVKVDAAHDFLMSVLASESGTKD